jgi:2-keto-4-pentenoate hydratase
LSESQIATGLRRQLEGRSILLDSGLRSIGWKAAFGAPAFLERFGLDGPVVGFLTDGTVQPNGAVVDVSGWTRGVAEPELAVYLGADLPGRPDQETIRSSIAAVGPAIELADINLPFDDLEEVLAGDVFHRAVIFGASDRTRNSLDLAGLEATVRRDGNLIASTTEIEELTGQVAEVIARLAALLADHGETMRSGDVVICGSVVPPIELTSATTIEFTHEGFPTVSVTTA